jgi:hypothetical protein
MSKYETSTLPINPRLARAIFSEDDLDVHARKERDGLADLEREESDPEASHHRTSHKYPKYQVVKALTPDGQWHGLYVVRGNQLPNELQGSFTSVLDANKCIEAYLNQPNRKELN